LRDGGHGRVVLAGVLVVGNDTVDGPGFDLHGAPRKHRNVLVAPNGGVRPRQSRAAEQCTR
jgi:hypothetical protein